MPHRRWLALLVILAADVMDLLDGSVLNVALPAIRADLGAGNTALQWISAGYTLAFAVVLITGARLGDIHGRKRIFQIGLAAFVVASLLCALAPSAGALVATRLLQGAAAAIMMPQVLGIIRTSFPPKEMAAAFGLVGPIMGLTAALGPAVGGILVDADLFGTGWRAVFLINLPIGLIALACTSRLVRESRAPHPVRLDLVGMLLLSVAVALVFHPLVQGTDFVRMAAALPVLGLFIAHQRRRKSSPLIELTLFRKPAFSAGLLVSVLFFCAMSGFMLVLTLFLQLGLGYSAMRAGLTTIPWALGITLGAILAAVLGERAGRPGLQVALLTCAAGAVALHFTTARYGTNVTSWQLVPALVLFGLGMGSVIGPLFGFILAGVDDHEIGSASGVLEANQQLAGAVGVAAVGSLFFHRIEVGSFTAAVQYTMIVIALLMAATATLTFLLPRSARDEDQLDELRAAQAGV